MDQTLKDAIWLMTDYGPEQRDTTVNSSGEGSKRISDDRAKQAVSGHGVRYVLIFSLCAVIVVLVILGLIIAKNP